MPGGSAERTAPSWSTLVWESSACGQRCRAGLVRQANTALKHKVLFVSDYPAVNPDRWLTAFNELEIKGDVRPLVMKEMRSSFFSCTDVLDVLALAAALVVRS